MVAWRRRVSFAREEQPGGGRRRWTVARVEASYGESMLGPAERSPLDD